MRKLLIIAAVVLGLATALPIAAAAGSGGADRPFKGTATGTVLLDLATLGLSVDATGQFTHLGLTHSTQTGHLVPRPTPGVFTYVSVMTLTAANGDELFADCAGTLAFVDPTHSHTEVTCVGTGGTGRFVAAELTFSAAVDGARQGIAGTVVTSAIDVLTTGTITY